VICICCRRNEPGARPANSRTRRPVNGGGAVMAVMCLHKVEYIQYLQIKRKSKNGVKLDIYSYLHFTLISQGYPLP
jgi:hypothetical protein